MRLVVGLGNPGKKFSDTRHNVGFAVVDALVEVLGTKNFELSVKHNSLVTTHKIPRTNRRALLAKPRTFMNNSGDAVSSIANFHKIFPENIYIIHDDLDIALGKYKVQKGKGPKDHNGVSSVEEKLGTKNFWRVRVGVENRASGMGHRISGEDYVLQRFTGGEKIMVTKVLGEITKEITILLQKKS